MTQAAYVGVDLYYAVSPSPFTTGRRADSAGVATKSHPMQRLPRLVELILIIALCGLAALWITRIARGTPIAVPPLATTNTGGANSRVDDVLVSARLFGSRPPGVLSDNVRPLGVIADASGRGSVIVSVDGQPAKIYRVGDTLDGRLVSAIRADEIELESGGARQIFRLPPPRPSTGVTVLGTGEAVPAPPGDTFAAPPARRPRIPSVRQEAIDNGGLPPQSRGASQRP
jgi:hypothetical protein